LERRLRQGIRTNGRLTSQIHKELIMTIHRPNHYFGRHNLAPAVKPALTLLALAVLGYVAIAVAQHTPSLLNATSNYGLENQIMNLEPETPDAHATTGVASAAEPAAVSPQQNIDYFLNGYLTRRPRSTIR
jgi:hypothetical protein